MKKLTWHVRNQQGLASIVIVGVLVVLLTLVSLGFARLVERSTVNSTNRQLSSASTYAAQSGINDVIAYMKAYAKNPVNASAPYVASTQCTGANSLIGSSGSQGPFYNDSNISGDGNTKYDCILLNQTPTQLIYQNIPDLKSQVVKLTTSAIGGALDQFMFSWQPSVSSTFSPNYPPNTLPLLDENTWNSDPNNYMPILRVSLYPVPASGSVSDLQKNSKTVYLYPQPAGGGTIVQHLAYSSLSNGQLLAVPCDRAQTTGTGFTGTANYRCNMIISQLTQSVSAPSTDPINYVYARVTPIYGPLDVAIQANDIDSTQLKFIGDQAVVDVTASVSNVSKRLQARVDISTETASNNGIDDNVSATVNGIPEAGIRSADALCKQITAHQGLYPYISFDASSSNICNNSGTVIPTPGPTLTFTITGNGGTDAGRTVDSEAANPDTPQSPVQNGTVYINSGSTATFNWTMADATNCNATSTRSDLTGNVLVSPYNTVTTYSRDHSSSIGSWTTPAITSAMGIQKYNLDCSGPGGTAARKTVTAWPYPIASISGPGSVHAADNYTISWSSTNAVKCVLSGGSWTNPGNTATAGSETMTWPYDDNSSTRTFTATCTDPIGRAAVVSWTVSTGGQTQVLPPNCSASVTPVDNGNGTGYFTWSGSCPETNPPGPSVGYYQLYNCVNVDCASIGSGGWVGTGGTSPTLGVGHYCVYLQAGVNPWGWRAYSPQGSAGCFDIYYPQVVINSYTVLAWDNGPYECGLGTGFYQQWMCRNGDNVYADPDGVVRAHTLGGGGGWGCADSSHRFGVCGGQDYWSVTGATSCTESSSAGPYDTKSGSGNQSSGPWQWVNVGGVYPFTLTCNGPTPGPGGGPNKDTKTYNG